MGEAEEETALGKAPYTHKAEIEVEKEPHAGGADRFFINPGGKGISYELPYPDGSSSTVIHFIAKQSEKKGELKIVLNPHAMWEKQTEFKEEIKLE